MELVYYLILAACFVACLANWRVGLYLCVLMDVVRDPVRKLTEDQSVLLTIATASLWLAVFLGVVARDQAQMWSAFRRYPGLKWGVVLLVLAILPGAFLSMILYRNGYVLSVIGVISYIAPLMGLAIGWTFPRAERDITKLLQFYVIVNSIGLIGTALEWQGIEFPGLGGIKMDWLRYHGMTEIKLIAGFYRSPDIMGLHAAHVAIFAMILAMRFRGLPRICWLSLAMWALACALISGRRKMIGIPLVFIAIYLFLASARGSRIVSSAGVVFTTLLVIAGVGMLAIREGDTTRDYQEYASTIFSQGFQRSGGIADSVLHTIYQSGLLGSGLGSATQGAHYAGIQTQKNWQEDGVSRLFKELGLPGVILVGVSGLCFLSVVWRGTRLIPPSDRTLELQLALIAVVGGNAASFISSHQQYSGDPMSGMLVLFLLGAALGMPRIRFQRLRRQQQSEQAVAPSAASTELAL